MPTIEITFNSLKRTLLRADFKRMGEMIIKASKDKKVDGMLLKITDDDPKGENAITIPFKIIDK